MLAQLILLVAPLLFPAFLSLALWTEPPGDGGRAPALTRAAPAQVERPDVLEAAKSTHRGCPGHATVISLRGGAVDGLHSA